MKIFLSSILLIASVSSFCADQNLWDMYLQDESYTCHRYGSDGRTTKIAQDFEATYTNPMTYFDENTGRVVSPPYENKYIVTNTTNEKVHVVKGLRGATAKEEAEGNYRVVFYFKEGFDEDSDNQNELMENFDYLLKCR